jgi:AcrR family transcriptional regulator
LDDTNVRAIALTMSSDVGAARQRILREGLDLVSATGLSGVTVGLLADRMGMSKSGLFAHFGSKEKMQIDLLRQMGQVSRETVVMPSMHAAEGLPRLKALVNNWLGWTARAGLAGGCPVAAAMFELDDLDGPVRAHVLAMEREWTGLIKHLVAQAIEHGHLARNLDVDQFVWELYGIYLSHHASYRFVRDPQADARASIAFAALIDRSRPLKPKNKSASPPQRHKPGRNR